MVAVHPHGLLSPGRSEERLTWPPLQARLTVSSAFWPKQPREPAHIYQPGRGGHAGLRSHCKGRGGSLLSLCCGSQAVRSQITTGGTQVGRGDRKHCPLWLLGHRGHLGWRQDLPKPSPQPSSDTGSGCTVGPALWNCLGPFCSPCVSWVEREAPSIPVFLLHLNFVCSSVFWGFPQPPPRGRGWCREVRGNLSPLERKNFSGARTGCGPYLDCEDGVMGIDIFQNLTNCTL